MRRPQGFDGPAPPRRPGAAETPTAIPTDAHASARSATGSRRPSGPRPAPANAVSADATDTEPIPVVSAAASVPVAALVSASMQSRMQAADAAETHPLELDAEVHRVGLEPESSRPGSGAAPTGGPSGGSSDAGAIDDRSQRRTIAEAERMRRKYERTEVRRFTQRTRRRRIAWISGTAAVVLVAAGVVGAAYSPLMALREVRIEGAQRIPVDQLQAAFAHDLGTPLPLVTSADVRTALSAFPLIETYATETVPPSTLVVRIVERTPIGVIQTDDGLELVDAAGVVIDRPAERPDGEPLIEAGPIASAGFRAAGAVVRSLPADVRTQLVHVSAATADDVRLELAGGASVVWGSAEQSDLKAASLGALMVTSPPDSVGVYDVSAPMSPVTK